MSEGQFRPIEIAREYFPTLKDDALSSILWEHTGFPEFWPVREGESNLDCLRRQLKAYAAGQCDCFACRPPADYQP